MINPTSKNETPLRPDFAASKSPRAVNSESRAVDADRLSASNQESLQNILSKQPEVRPEMVERGTSLLVDGNYPPKEIIRQLSELFTSTADLAE